MTKQYLDLCNRILTEGVLVPNERTGIGCLTVINADLVYDVGAGEFPLVSTRKAPVKLAIAELLGYVRGYDSAKDFREIGTRSWDMNANENKAWLENPIRKGEDDMGRVYGVQGRSWQSVYLDKWDEGTDDDDTTTFLMFKGYQIRDELESEYTTVLIKSLDQLRKVYENLKNGIDDRGEIVTYWNPGEFDQGCLRPCLHSYQFSLLDGVLYLNATQRSCDVPLGLVANMQQCYWFLAIMAHITGHKAGKVFHKIVNAHIYENQIELMKEQVKREPREYVIADFDREKIKTLEDLEKATASDFWIDSDSYQPHPAIQYPFAV